MTFIELIAIGFFLVSVLKINSKKNPQIVFPSTDEFEFSFNEFKRHALIC